MCLRHAVHGFRRRRQPVLKPTRWMSNAEAVFERLADRCGGRHAQHTPLFGGRASEAAVFPPELVIAIALVLREQSERGASAGRAACPLNRAILEAIAEEPREAYSMKAEGPRAFGEYMHEEIDPK